METSSQQLCDDLLTILSRLKSAMATVADTHELTPSQLYALYILVRGEANTMGGLAAALHCDASNVTGIVDRLVAQGLVTTQIGTQDRRAKILTLEPAGLAVINDFIDDLPRRMGCPTSEAEGQKLHAFVAKISAA